MPHSLTDLAGLKVSAEDFLSAVLETAAQAIWVVDPDDLIRFANPAAITALGYDSADELLGRDSHETIHHKHPDGTRYPAAECPMRLPRTTGQTVTRDLDWFVRRDGSMFPVSYVSVPIAVSAGRGAVVAFTDIEDRPRAEEVLRERDAVLGAREDSLRRIAALVAGGAASADVFAAIAREVGYVVGVSLVVVCRYDPGRATATVIGVWSEFPHPFQAGTRWPLDGPTLLFLILKTGRPAKIDDFTGIPGTIADAGRKAGFGAAAGAPIIVDGEIWGAMMANAGRGPVPDRMEERLAAFTELLATAISNTESRAGLGRLAEEQAALRRVATLVARGEPPESLFAAVVEEVGQLLPVEYAGLSRYEPEGALSMVASSGRALDHIPVGSRWTLGGKNVATMVFETGRPSRIDSYADPSDPGAVTAFREVGVRSAVGTPIVVDGRLWGVMIAGTTAEQPIPADTEARLASFTELLATAIANAESRAGLARLAEEQAALRRVATLVARGTRPEEVFAAVANEVARLLSVDVANVCRYESDGTVTFVASAGERVPVGSPWPLGETNLARLVLETGRPARLDNYADATGLLAEGIREAGIRSAVATPIIVEGRLWGLIAAGSSQEQPLPPDTEARLASFTRLVATAIANTEARLEVGRLVDDQAALRRVATLVAEGAAPSEVFQMVIREVGILCGADLARMERYESGDSVIGVAGWSRGDAPELAVGKRFSLEGASIAAMVHEASRPVRVDSFADAHGPIAQEAQGLGIRSSVGCPIIVDGRLWGVIAASSKSATPFPPDTESQIAEFTELVATAIANTEARTQLGRLADEQAALRRVATLVARESQPAQVFAAVAEEVGRLLGAEGATLMRYEPDGTASAVAGWGERGAPTLVGTRISMEGENVTAQVLRTGRPARVDHYADVTGSIGSQVRELGFRSAVGCPIVVGGRPWGALVVGSRQAEPLSAGTESRIGEFTELVATAIANIQARSELAASRARIVAATDEERRRVVRDLHDGAQQRLVHTVITLKLAHRAWQNEGKDLPALLTEALDHAQQAMAEVRELAHGILPEVLKQGGLRAGVDALASRMPVPVEIDVSPGRLPAAVEATAYFLVAEALTNVAKHAHARHASVVARVDDGTLRVQVRDDGIGGAQPNGSGLLGLADRLAVLDGQLRVESPVDAGTLVAGDIPVRDELRMPVIDAAP